MQVNDKFDIEIEDDVPQEEAPASAEKASQVAEEDGFDSDEIEDQGGSSKKRSRNVRLKAQRDREREARVFWEQKARELDERLASLNKKTVEAEEKGTKVLLESINERIKSTKADITRAFNDGEAEKFGELQERLAELAAEKKVIERSGGSQKQEVFTGEAPPKSPPPQSGQNKVDPRTEQWIKENPWFNENKAMAGAALGIDADLKEEGYDGTEDEYWQELDARIQEMFPQLSKKKKPATPPVSRSSAGGSATAEGGKIKVRLSEEDKANARRLGVSLEEFARYKVKQEKAENGWVNVGN